MWIRQAKLVNLVIHKKRRCTGCGKGKGIGEAGVLARLLAISLWLSLKSKRGIGAPRERMGCMIG